MAAMDSSYIVKYFGLLFLLLNPFLLSVYLLELIHSLKPKQFASVLLRGSLIAAAAYAAFAVFGDAIFRDVLQVRFEAFQIFGGVIFLILGIRFVFGGVQAIYEWKGDPEYLAGSIAMPFLIGPATISACVMMGKHLDVSHALIIIAAVIFLMNVSLFFFKWLYDYLSERNEKLIRRYVEIIGRISALYIGVISVEMILKGLEAWMTTAF